MRIKQFLTENGNTHLYHVEEDIIRNGLVGAKSAVRYLFGLVDMLEGDTSADARATVKWDGAPAIVCGKDPMNGKFFVGTKSVFNSKNPKIVKKQSKYNPTRWALTGKDDLKINTFCWNLYEKIKNKIKEFK